MAKGLVVAFIYFFASVAVYAGNPISFKVISVTPSRFESYVKMIKVSIGNNTQDTLFLEKRDKFLAHINNSLTNDIFVRDTIIRDTFFWGNAEAVFKNINIKESNFEGSVDPLEPSILFTDSAANFNQYYQQFIEANNLSCPMDTVDIIYYRIIPMSTIYLYLNCTFEPADDVYHIYTKKNKKKSAQLALKLNSHLANGSKITNKADYIISDNSLELYKVFK